MGNLKRAIIRMKKYRDHRKVERERDLAEKNAQLGENLPDVGVWEEYTRDEKNVSEFMENLEALEKASDEDIKFLEDRPGTVTRQFLIKLNDMGLFDLFFYNSQPFLPSTGSSPLRDTFNRVAEFVATRQLFSAARPCEVCQCKYEELLKTATYRGVLYIGVAEHKTAATKQASIAVEKRDQDTFLRYVAILKRFNKKPSLAFPFISPGKGFVVSTAKQKQKKNNVD